MKGGRDCSALWLLGGLIEAGIRWSGLARDAGERSLNARRATKELSRCNSTPRQATRERQSLPLTGVSIPNMPGPMMPSHRCAPCYPLRGTTTADNLAPVTVLHESDPRPDRIDRIHNRALKEQLLELMALYSIVGLHLCGSSSCTGSGSFSYCRLTLGGSFF